jgi:hypothetical protein
MRECRQMAAQLLGGVRIVEHQQQPPGEGYLLLQHLTDVGDLARVARRLRPIASPNSLSHDRTLVIPEEYVPLARVK